MMIRELLLVILLLFIGQVVASGDSVLPEERNSLSHDPLNPNMLQCPKTVEGKAGDTVILPCSTEDKLDISHEEVEWLFEDPTTGKKTVHLYFQGEDFLHGQRDDFKDRTSLFKEGLSSGNCSLSLLVTTSYSGTYYCSVPGHRRCTLTLKVLPKVKNDSSQKHQDVTESPEKPNSTDGLTPNNLTIGVGVVVAVVVVAFIGLGVCLYRKHLYLTDCSGMKPKNQQTHPSASYHQAQQPRQNEEKKPLDQNPNEEQTPLKVVVDQDN